MKSKAERGIILLTALAALVVMSFLLGLTHWLAISSVRLERFYRIGIETTQDELSHIARQYLNQDSGTSKEFRCLDGTSRSLCTLAGPLLDFSKALAATTACQNLVPLAKPRTDLFSSSIQSNSSCYLTGNLNANVALRSNCEATQITFDPPGSRFIAASGFLLAAEIKANAPLTILAGGDIRIEHLIAANEIILVSGTGVVSIARISGRANVSAFAAHGVFMPIPNAGLFPENVPTRSFEPIGFLPTPK